MTKQFNYDLHYDQAFQKEYEKIISALEFLFRKKDSISKEEKLKEFRNENIRKFWSLKQWKDENGNLFDDTFLTKLANDFKFRNRKYDDFPVTKFITDDVPILRAEYKRQPFSNKISEKERTDLLNFLAQHNSLEKFIEDSRDIWLKKEDTVEEAINIIRLGRDNRGLKSVDSEVPNLVVRNLQQSTAIEWLGSQKQLAELIIKLSEKGWIKEINVSQIQSSFTKSKTIDQVLKPDYDPDMKKNLYSQVYTTKYQKKFDKIKTK
jgi:hypothetical protein